ncbi:MAG: SulP family inorganic anion transporter [Gammaproteobacteria bacterium]|nr:SulP family inorganic anion transporter [Gammaproteobacteria bacterium]
MKLDTSNLRGDVYGGITAGVVALPLALALGVASGMGAIAGLYGAIFVGFFAALFGGTRPQISGPTGPMVVVLAGLVATLPGRPELIFTAIVLAGLFQILFGVLGFGHYIRLVPYPVVSGFMSGIGAIIIILQVGRLVGGEPPGDTVSALIYVPHALSDINFSAVAIGAVTLGIVFWWPREFGKYLPGPLAGLIAGTLMGLVLSSAPVLGAIPSGLPTFHMPQFDRASLFLIVEAALILAALGAIDSLLTSLVADNVTRTRHDSNRELIGQGIGNTAAGLFGGIAGAGATMRTLVNIRTGGKTPISGMLHALLLLAIVLGLAPLASRIPHAALAGILVKVGWDIIDWSYLKNAHRGPRWDLILMALVLGLTVFVDLITAVVAGVVLASIAYVRQVAQAQIRAITELPASLDSDEEEALLAKAKGRVSVFDFGGPLSFGAAADLGHHVRERTLKRGTEALVLDFGRVPFMDVSAARAVETIACDARHAGRRVYCSGVREEVQKVLAGLNADHCIPADGRFPRRIDALRAAVESLERPGPGPDAVSAPYGANPATG